MTITANGLQIPTIEQMLSSLSTQQKATLEASLDTEADSPMGQLNGIFVERLREVWEGLDIAWNGMNPDAAEDFLLDALSALTGTKRGAATASVVLLNLNLDANVTVFAGALVSAADNPLVVFATDADVTQGPVGGVVEDIAATCTVLGRTVANAGTLTVIQTPTVGWNTVTNPEDTIVGHERDTDPELRLRRLEELGGAGSGTVQAVRSAVLQIQLADESKPVLDAIVDENISDYPSDSGQPGHSVEAILWDGEAADAPDDDIAQAIWDNKGGGITAYGNDTGTAVDEEGHSHTVGFTRVAQVDAKLTITVVVNKDDPSTYPGDTLVLAALVDEHEVQSRLGRTELRNKGYSKAVMALTGILDISNLQLGTVGDAFLTNGANYPIPLRTKILLDTSDITIVVTLDEP